MKCPYHITGDWGLGIGEQRLGWRRPNPQSLPPSHKTNPSQQETERAEKGQTGYAKQGIAEQIGLTPGQKPSREIAYLHLAAQGVRHCCIRHCCIRRGCIRGWAVLRDSILLACGRACFRRAVGLGEQGSDWLWGRWRRFQSRRICRYLLTGRVIEPTGFRRRHKFRGRLLYIRREGWGDCKSG